jgi:hypothetical protein
VKTTTIAAILEDGSFTSKGVGVGTAARETAADSKLVSLSPAKDPYLAFPDSILKTGVSWLSPLGNGNVWALRSVTYEMSDAGGTGSQVTSGGWFIAGSIAGTATVRATALCYDETEMSTMITVKIVSTPSEETVYETVSTNWPSLEPAPNYAGGDGTESNPYRISSLRQLRKLSYDMELLGSVETTYQRYFQLTADLDFTDDGTVTQSLVSGTFYGSFDGLGHVIKNLRINAVGGDIGIFQSINFGEIKNLGREGGSTNGSAGGIGGLVGALNNSKMINCFNSSSLNSTIGVGGLVGGVVNNSLIENCYNTGDMVATLSGVTGGLVATITSGAGGTTFTIKNSYNIGKITDTNRGFTGGLAGYTRNAGTIIHTLALDHCYNLNDIIGTNTNSRYGAILGISQDNLFNIIATDVYTKPNAVILDGVPTSRLIGWGNLAFVDNWIAANPTMKEDAKYTIEYSKSTAFATELGDAFKYAPGRTPKLAWEK